MNKIYSIKVQKEVKHRTKYIPTAEDILVDIQEAPGYKLTNKGEIISYKYPEPYYVNPYKVKSGGYVVDLRVNNKYIHIRISKLLAKYFPIPVPKGYTKIKGFDGYFINDKGDIISDNPYNKSYKGRIKLTHSKDSNGYCVVTINNKSYKVHRLVAMTFIPNPNGYSQINHKDEDKTNNTVENLEWCTSQYNNTYNDKHYRSTRWACKKCKLTNINTNVVKIYDSINSVAGTLGVNKATVAYHIKHNSILNNTYKIELYGIDS